MFRKLNGDSNKLLIFEQFKSKGKVSLVRLGKSNWKSGRINTELQSIKTSFKPFKLDKQSEDSI